MAFSHSPKIVTDGLVLCLDAANPKSYPGTGTNWKDLSGNSLDFTLENSPTFSTSNTGYFDLDGTNDSAILSDTDTLSFTNASLTLEAWVKLDDLTDTGIITKVDYANNQREWGIIIRSSTLSLQVNPNLDNGGTWTIVYATSTSINVWYHVVGTSDGIGTGKIYLNGVLNNTNSSFATSTGNGNAPIRVGAETNGGVQINPVNGKIALTKVYNRALTAAEIKQNFEATRGRFGL